MPEVSKHPQARLYPSELVTLAVLFVLKGSSGRAFYRWIERDYRHLFPKLNERTRLFRLFAARLRRRLAAVKAFVADGRPLRLFFEDEARIGLKLPRYRRVTARGVAPKQPYEPLYKYYWLYGTVEPKTGEAFYQGMPRLDSLCFSAFLGELARAYPKSLNVVVLDNAPAHIASDVAVPENVVLLFLPAYSPELNPVERLWLAVRERIDVFDEAVRM